MPDEACLLNVDDLVTGYGKKQVVNGITLHVASNEIVALIGHNGAGKSTLLKAIFGVLPIWRGSVTVNGLSFCSPNPRELLSIGVAYVPQGNRVFSDLSVRENLDLGSQNLTNKAERNESIGRVFKTFPILKGRLRQKAGNLSGGEKQMLALANALIVAPRLLLLDEPSLGLAPPLASKALAHIAQINRESNGSILIVEQNVREVLKIAQRVYVLRNGRISFSGTSDSLKDEKNLREVYL
ncbi:MAG: branched-chain amino acid transport system ATP-binding protein [Acidobacteriota bacterium]|nr:branched-chain amino acid transport system ATP-binding protein [Acidobacteriota bacterium]